MNDQSCSTLIKKNLALHWINQDHDQSKLIKIEMKVKRATARTDQTACDSFRKARKAHIIQKAKTLEPLGINKHEGL